MAKQAPPARDDRMAEDHAAALAQNIFKVTMFGSAVFITACLFVLF